MSDDYGQQWWPRPYSNQLADEWPINPLSCSNPNPLLALPEGGLNVYSLALTKEQATKILSAISIGLHFGYPFEYETLRATVADAWTWVNNPVWWAECDNTSGGVNVDLCEIIQNCLRNAASQGSDPGVSEGPGSDGPERGDFTGNEVITTQTDLDCIWGATDALWEGVLDYINITINNARLIVSLITEGTDTLVAIASSFKSLTGTVLAQVADAFAEVSLAALDEYETITELQAVEDAFRCEAFCLIQEGGEPYTLSTEDIRAALDAWGAAMVANVNPLFFAGIEAIRPLVKNTVNYNVVLNQWLRAADDGSTCNNDWDVLCDCATGWCAAWFDGDGYAFPDLELIAQPIFSTLPPAALVYNSTDDRLDGVTVGTTGGVTIRGGSCEIEMPPNSTVVFEGFAQGAAGFAKAFIQDASGASLVTPFSGVTGPFSLTYTSPITQTVLLKVRNRVTTADVPWVSKITINSATGSNPYGTSNC